MFPGYTEYAKTLIGVLSIVNPLGAIPVFLSLTGSRGDAEQRRVARVAASAVAAILVVAVWTGELILGFFGIGVPAFRVAGGLLVLLMAIAMLHARTSDARHTNQEAGEAAAPAKKTWP